MASNLDMHCIFCADKLLNPDHFSVDEQGNIIAACQDCYLLMLQFQKGGRK